MRNSNTSSVSVLFRYEKFNQGMSLDIFPLDYYSSCNVERKFAIVKELAYDLGTVMRMNNPNLDETNLKRVESFSGRDPMQTYNMIQSICREESEMNSDLVGCLSWNVYGASRQSFRKELYGNYLDLPPVESRGNWHTGSIDDMEKPYTDYLLSL